MRLRELLLASLLAVSGTSIFVQTACRQANSKVIEHRDKFTILRITLPSPQLAAEVGYESEAAFNRAFKRRFEVPPARFRSNARTGQVKVAH